MTTTYVLDAGRFSTLEEFYDEISRVVIPQAEWGRNLDAFNDILRGGFGTPETGFRLRWINSERSRNTLGYAETIRQLEKRLQKCHSTNRAAVVSDLAEARSHRGPTVFDWLVEVIQTHGIGGSESEDQVELVLE